MSTLRIIRDDATLELSFTDEGLLAELLERAGMPLERECGGQGTCGRCVVRVLEGLHRQRMSAASPPTELASEGYVLACQTRAHGDITLRVQGQMPQRAEGIEEAPYVLLSERLLPKRWEIEPISRKCFLRVPPPTLDDSFSDFDRLTGEIQKVDGLRGKEPFCELELLRELPAVLREQDGEITVGLLPFSDTYTILNYQAGDRVEDHYGIACDIGTTTVAVSLVDLNTGEVLGSASTYNLQTRCGSDVISRIEYARRPGRLVELQRLVAQTVNVLVTELTHRHAIGHRDVSNAVFTGNTTMIHLLAGIDPKRIRESPYVPAVNRCPQFKAWELGVKSINPHTRVFCAPGVGSYVGGDITAGLLCVERGERPMIYLDIGTNGELAIGNHEWLVACACSAGPAFEGGAIGCGMRAAQGAIERVTLKDGGRGVAYRTIGATKPRGICGSALIELVGELLREGIVDRAGSFRRTDLPRVRKLDGRTVFVVEWGASSATGSDVYLSDRDIQTIIRAKAAIYAAMRILLDKVGLRFSQIDSFYIAGGFGRYLNTDAAVRLGLLPDIERERFRYIGNASLLGGYLSLLSRHKRQQLANIAGGITYIELSVEPGYMQEFSGAMFLPHTDRSLFPSF